MYARVADAPPHVKGCTRTVTSQGGVRPCYALHQKFRKNPLPIPYLSDNLPISTRKGDAMRTNIGKVVRDAWGARGYRAADYCKASGKSSSTVSQSLGSNMSVGLASDMLAFANYRLVAVPVGNRLADGCFVVEGEEDGR